MLSCLCVTKKLNWLCRSCSVKLNYMNEFFGGKSFLSEMQMVILPVSICSHFVETAK